MTPMCCGIKLWQALRCLFLHADARNCLFSTNISDSNCRPCSVYNYMQLHLQLQLYNSVLPFQQATGTTELVEGKKAFTFQIGGQDQVFTGSFKFDASETHEFNVEPQEDGKFNVEVKPPIVGPITMECTAIVRN